MYVPTYLCCILFFRHLKIAQSANTRFIFVHSFGSLKTSNFLQEKLADIAVLEQQLTDLCQTNPAAADSDDVKALKARLVTYTVTYAVKNAVTYRSHIRSHIRSQLVAGSQQKGQSPCSGGLPPHGSGGRYHAG